jgi:hypothetical protein
MKQGRISFVSFLRALDKLFAFLFLLQMERCVSIAQEAGHAGKLEIIRTLRTP